ncbi:related to ROT1 - molecular chaperone in the endoplasmic reticulum [Melanopsichium pennsylvanicum]|uniref:Protein ROT1 n=2 Tax=Melanopsichium pennsylvanicum TaxID=63383 RepID=A0AAJ4XS02_9BASI|nr:related to ROT1-molecular chaperone in the endoplasmic reticulum [Melanopsichium pennsylvanicum 4]SNX86787.1 related to ROT1 - molecular chaperone in the endoplasmic reticulum [Melanopsichium pennsylvanicum]
MSSPLTSLFISVTIVVLAAAQSTSRFDSLIEDLAGTWSTGSGAVRTGPGFWNPRSQQFTVPRSAGHSFSFTKDGFWEEALFQWGNDPTYPQCVQATLLWQHGNFYIDALNGTLRMDPFLGDGFQSQWTGCDTTSSATSNNTVAPVAAYNQVYLYNTPAVSTDSHYGVSSYKLEMAQLSGELLNPMWKVLNPPTMLPTEVLHIKVRVLPSR